MDTKRCVFCDKIVPVKQKADYYSFIGCLCAPGESYKLRADSYELYASLSHQTKHLLFPIVSAYIRELIDCEEPVSLTFEDLETIRSSPRVPVTIEAKADKLLQYFRRQAKGPNETVVIRQLGDHYNLTYSPNLQELVHIIEKLRDEQLLERTGASFKLTEKGWQEAEAKAEGKRLMPCAVIVPGLEEKRKEWSMTIFPKLQQCGYIPSMIEYSKLNKVGDSAFQTIAESKLLVADLSGDCADIYFAAGYALGQEVPVLISVQRSEAERLAIKSSQMRPIVWEQTEELADKLQQRLLNV
ncbi:hypothetical protein [Paenibacillus ginsengarvi]|uniref:Uncharacterized protein n=1 Tax=Paenibacillus ginsengarvi TaxID=400777 RepID=A0A3B0BHS3_9BACL|nr:hypothetical protein [Paenibacillus ginsengarvi]RKN71901.1 hypothetical protein D7M11_29170 [Paenibacillus ginsengarvi]